MRKFYLTLLILIILFIPLAASAATVSGSLNQLTAHYTRPMENITVSLEAENGAVVQDTTNDDGEYRFTGVANGRYRITVKLPSDHVPALMNDNNRLLPGTAGSGQTDWFEVSGNTTVNLASTRMSVFIRCIAFVDENANGGRMTSEPLLKDVEVSLYPAGHPEMQLMTGATDRKGEITFNTLSPGEYQLKVVMPDHYSVGPLGAKINIYYNCFKPTETQESWSDPVTVESGSLGLGIGAVVTGSAEGSVWYDENGDGRKDSQEGGLANVEVALTDATGEVTRTTVTDAAGAYRFSKLQPGTYTVKVTAPEGYMFSPEGGDSWLTAGYSATDEGTVTVKAESTAKIRTVGLMNATGLRVAFYHDANGDGMRGGDELPYAGAKLNVSANNQIVAEMLSDENGLVVIPILRAGNIEVSAEVQPEETFSAAGDNNDFAANAATALVSIPVTLTPGETLSLDAAVTLPAQVGGLLFMDADDNGLLEHDEQPAPGFTVQAVDWNGQIVASTTTDAAGAYLFDRLLPVPHTIRFLLNDPYIAAPYAESGEHKANSIITQTTEYGETDLLHLAPGSFTGDVNGALFQAGTLSGRIRIPDSRPQGMSEGLAGVTVTLTTPDDQPVSDYTVDVSDEEGNYYLKGILPGVYQLRYTLPQDALFADTDELVIHSTTFESSMGSDIRMDDVYALPTAYIEGQVLCEGAPADAMITAVNTETGYTISFPAEAASDGRYALRLLRPGTWEVTVTLGEGFSFAEDTALVPAIAHNISRQVYTFDMGDALKDQNILVTRPATVTGLIFLDEDLSGNMDAAELPQGGLKLALVNRDGETAAEFSTDESGRFASPLIVPGHYQLVFTLDEDCILPSGTQLSVEQWAYELDAVSGRNTDVSVPVVRFASIGGRLWSLDDSLDFVANIEVQLFRADDLNVPIAVTATDAQGRYRFSRLYPGEYRLTALLPEGHGFARRSDTNETHVSLILSNDENTVSDVLKVSMGVNIADADFGFGAKGSIGDFAWLDENRNGMQDIGERGVPGIRIQLYQDDELLAETETDIYGHYMLENIYPGHYTLRVTMLPELAATTYQTEFPLIGSVLPESDALTVDATDVIVPSGTRNLAVDIGLMLREDGVYPAVMDTIPTTDWSFGGRKR